MCKCNASALAPREVAAMNIVSNTTRGANRVARHAPPQLSCEARLRLVWLDHYGKVGNVTAVCRLFGISRQTFYRWRRRYNPQDLQTLEDRSCRPKRIRKPTWTEAEIAAVRELREEYPRWGKQKLAAVLKHDGMVISASKVGRILGRLREQGVLEEPRRALKTRQRRLQRPYAVGKPQGYAVLAPGDLVQVDTMDVRLLPGVVLKHFTMHDVVSRWNAVELAQRATATTAVRVFEKMLARLPYKVKAVQVDNGSEFKAEFEAMCQRRGIRLFVLPPRSPKLNGAVERANRTHAEEFYECCVANPTVAELGRELRLWEIIYNKQRPHQALGYLTPHEFIIKYYQQKEVV